MPDQSSLLHRPSVLSGSAFLWVGLSVGASGGVYLSSSRVSDFGATWLLALALVAISSYAVANARHRSHLALFAVVILALVVFRVSSSLLTRIPLTLPGLLLLWLVALLFVSAAIRMIASQLGIRLRPPNPYKDATDTPGQASPLYFVWIAVYFRSLTLLLIPLSLTAAAWGANWQHKVYPCFGMDFGTSTAFATLPSLGFLLGWSILLQRRLERSSEGGKGRSASFLSKVLALLTLFYLWGLFIEWRSTQNYIAWTLLVGLLTITVALFRLASLVRSATRGEVGTLETLASGISWNWPAFVFQVLLVFLFFLFYGTLVQCMIL